MKYRFIDAMKAKNHFVQELCELVGVPQRSYYLWASRKDKADRRFRSNEDEVLEAIVQTFHKKKRRYGRPRIVRELRRAGLRVGGQRVARIMRERGLVARSGRKRSAHKRVDSAHKIAPNLLDRRFDVEAPNEVWAGDVTQVNVGGVWLFLAVVLDLYSRRVVGFRTSTSAETSLVTGAMKNAARGWLSLEGLVFHSDQGTIYASQRFQEQLSVLGVTASMSRRGNCWDNAPVESFFASMKKKLIHGEEWSSVAELRASIVEYVSFYNNERIHSALDYQTPAEYEERAAA